MKLTAEINKSSNKTKYIMDSFMVLLNLSTSYSVIPYLVFRNFDRYVNMILLIVVNIIYFTIRFKGNNHHKKKHQQNPLPKRKSTLILLYVAINIVCFISGLATGTGGMSTLIYLVLNVEFYWLLCRLFDEYSSSFSVKDSYQKLIRGYKGLALLSLVGCILMFAFIKMGGDPNQNPIGNKYDLFFDNAVNFGSMYYFPFHICIVDTNPDIRLPFFQEAGIIEGLYHEPHCMTFMLFPALYLLLYYSKNRLQKVFWILSFLFIILLTGSTTNLAAVLMTLVVYMFYTFKSSFSKSLVLLFVLAIIYIGVITYVDLETFSFITAKVEGGSRDYSVSTLDFAMHPRSLLGTSFYNLSYINSSTAAKTMDVGWITFFLNGAFLLVCISRLVKLFKKKSPLAVAVLLFAVYFFTHSAKVAMVSYSLTMLIFVIFLIEETARIPDRVLLNDEKVSD